jgi:predicted nucleic acid-binding protein
MVEAYSVLTRIPVPHRLAASKAAEVLIGFFGADRMLSPSPDLMKGIVGICGNAGIAGGAVYDALIGSIADEHGATLLTLDRRAIRTYQRLGISAELLTD